MDRNFLKRFMHKTLLKENFVAEKNEIDQDTADSMKKSDQLGGMVPTTGTAAPDNKNALEVDLSIVDLKSFGLPKQNKYYVWSKSKGMTADGKQMKAFGNLLRKGGDPFTYQKEGERYRVMSGPSLSSKYGEGSKRAGQKIGTRPIGALLKISASEFIDPPPQSDARPSLAGLKPTIEGYEQDATLAAGFLETINRDTFDDLIAKLGKAESIDAVSGVDGASAIKRLTVASTTGSANTPLKNIEIMEAYLNAVNPELSLARGTIKLPTKAYVTGTRKRSEEDNPASVLRTSGDSQPQADQRESLSRGSLLRRRYRRF